MGQGTREIREEIERTRARVGEEVEALSYKTDVRARVGDSVSRRKQGARTRVRRLAERVIGLVGDARERGTQLVRSRRS